MQDDVVHTGLFPLTVYDDIDYCVARDALIDDEQVNVTGRILGKHADRLQVDIDLMPTILNLHLLQ
ncbi:hypothetical protein [Symmachiella dynata]|uniref:hypothetical protein n=1 Tax=Symmachiella dynata TaxID=2527995 RepID=UPI0030EE7658